MDDQAKEFHLASRELPEQDLKAGCFCSLPFIQSALALRALVPVGFDKDARVLSCYRSFLDIRQQASPAQLWCAIGCRHILEDRAKAARRNQGGRAQRTRG